MADFTTRFNELLSRTTGSDTDLAEALGVSKQTISAWKNGTRFPKRPAIRTIASHFGVSVPWLTGITDDDRVDTDLPSNVRLMSQMPVYRVPLIGSVAGGQPIYAPEDADVYVTSPIQCDAAMEVQGDSMAPTYLDGDTIYIKCCPDVREGAVAVVFLDDEATLKHVYKRPTGLTLIPDNRDHAPIMIEFEDYANVRIFGVPVGYTRLFKKPSPSSSRPGIKPSPF